HRVSLWDPASGRLRGILPAPRIDPTRTEGNERYGEPYLSWSPEHRWLAATFVRYGDHDAQVRKVLVTAIGTPARAVLQRVIRAVGRPPASTTNSNALVTPAPRLQYFTPATGRPAEPGDSSDLLGSQPSGPANGAAVRSPNLQWTARAQPD